MSSNICHQQGPHKWAGYWADCCLSWHRFVGEGMGALVPSHGFMVKYPALRTKLQNFTKSAVMACRSSPLEQQYPTPPNWCSYLQKLTIHFVGIKSWRAHQNKRFPNRFGTHLVQQSADSWVQSCSCHPKHEKVGCRRLLDRNVKFAAKPAFVSMLLSWTAQLGHSKPNWLNGLSHE